jgi:WD repeat-containing protein 20
MVFTSESILTICREGLIKIWVRPEQSENNQQSNSSEFALGPASKDRAITSSNKASSSSFKKLPPVLVT